MSDENKDLTFRMPMALWLRLAQEAAGHGVSVAREIRGRLEASFDDFLGTSGVFEIDHLCDASRQFAVALAAVAPVATETDVAPRKSMLRGGIDAIVNEVMPRADDAEGARMGATLASLTMRVHLTEKE
jgi:hypothetical protein